MRLSDKLLAIGIALAAHAGLAFALWPVDEQLVGESDVSALQGRGGDASQSVLLQLPVLAAVSVPEPVAAAVTTPVAPAVKTPAAPKNEPVAVVTRAEPQAVAEKHDKQPKEYTDTRSEPETKPEPVEPTPIADTVVPDAAVTEVAVKEVAVKDSAEPKQTLPELAEQPAPQPQRVTPTSQQSRPSVAARQQAGGARAGQVGNDGDQAQQTAWNDYKQTVFQTINARQSYPKQARLRREEGVVKVRFRVQRDGRIGHFELIRKSKSKRLNRSAQDLFSELRLPEPTEGIHNKLPATMTISLEYNLDKQA
ncbi:TonB family protein [Oceanobacter kriegii]|uniref:TonB family protein n=1 Tax=Oceanobacter kriegii TaxID=64972 RepID=UPI000424E392|nr:TonB family protein [Oceanobacter kriegii]